MGIGTVTVNINIDYIKELRLGEEITITTEPVRRGNTSFVLKHEIYNNKNEPGKQKKPANIIYVSWMKPSLLN